MKTQLALVNNDGTVNVYTKSRLNRTIFIKIEFFDVFLKSSRKIMRQSKAQLDTKRLGN
jgi:hypothetical protein